MPFIQTRISRSIAIGILGFLLAPVGRIEAQDATAPNATGGPSKESLPPMYLQPLEVFGGGLYLRGKSGPNLKSTNFGGWTISVTDYLTPSIGLTTDFQGTYGRAPIASQATLASDPLVYQHSYLVGPQIRWRKRERFASSYRVLVGATTSEFDSDLNGRRPQAFGMYPNATKLAIKLGGSFDINLKPTLALRIAPSTVFQQYNGQMNRQFSISTGLVFRFGGDRGFANRR